VRCFHLLRNAFDCVQERPVDGMLKMKRHRGVKKCVFGHKPPRMTTTNKWKNERHSLLNKESSCVLSVSRSQLPPSQFFVVKPNNNPQSVWCFSYQIEELRRRGTSWAEVWCGPSEKNALLIRMICPVSLDQCSDLRALRTRFQTLVYIFNFH